MHYYPSLTVSITYSELRIIYKPPSDPAPSSDYLRSVSTISVVQCQVVLWGRDQRYSADYLCVAIIAHATVIDCVRVCHVYSILYSIILLQGVTDPCPPPLQPKRLNLEGCGFLHLIEGPITD